ncbi:MAG TPA: spermidine/putrescine ABC transporter substrate-binding protein [Anaerolineales bacterium]|nr:spermidine/putrescine ABC transporter substrate-binding protein [Anaerolineales bacterium]
MKLLKYLAILIILSMLLVACGGGGAKSTEVNLYGWSEYVPQALLDGFTQETGIKVNYDTYSSNEELLAKLQAGASGYDVIIPSDYTVAIMINQGLLEEIDLKQIPNFKNLVPELTNPDFDPGNKYSVPYQWGTVGIVVDTDKVTRPITKWADLWDPEFKDRVVLLDDEREVLGMVLQTLGYDKNSTDPAQLEEAKAKLSELMPNVRLFDSDSPKTALLAGEVWLGHTWNGEAAIAHSENPAIDYICPEEGCGIWYDNLAVPKGAPHKDAALAFMNYVLKPEASLLITMEFPYSSPNQAALDLLKTQDPAAYEAYMGFDATNPPLEAIQNAKPIVDVGEATALWDRVWTEVKGGE